MATEFSFDVVSKVDLAEVKNAIDLVERELSGRYDFRNTKSKLTLEGDTIKVISDNEMQLETLLEILRTRLAKRSVSLKALEYGKLEQAAGGTVRQTITLKQGIPVDQSRKLVKALKDAGVKVNAQIQGEQLRVTAKEKDALQSAQRLIKGMEDLPFDVEFANYR